MTYLLALLPALGWGFMPVVAARTKAKPTEQLLGTTVAALIFALVSYFIVQPTIDSTIIGVCFVSGCFWTIGQYLQFGSFQLLPVSEAMPISNGSQLIFTTLTGAVIFSEWTSMKDFFVGILAILFIVAGIIFTSYQERATHVHGSRGKAVQMLCISSLALTTYVILPRLFNVSGFSVILPQAVGMFVSSVVIVGFKRQPVIIGKVSQNLFTGLLWSIANISLFMVMPVLGVSLGFTLSQLAVLVSIYGGLAILKVKKTKKEQRAILLGAGLIILGILLIGLLK